MRRALPWILLPLITACSLAPDYQTPKIDFPNQWEDSAAPTAPQPMHDWWTGFGDAQLNTLIAQALSQNNDLAAALAREAEAKANTDIAGSGLWPQLTAGGSATRTVDGGGTTRSANASMAYELDLFGKNRSETDAAIATWQARGYDRDALAITVAGDVTENYFGWLASNARLRIAQANLKNMQQVLKVIAVRYQAGRDSALELAQQKQDVATTQASIEALQALADSYRHQLAVLLGQAPQGFTLQPASLDALNLPQVASTLPSELISQRPDIRSAEAELRAANANIGAARAAFFPSLTLSASALVGNGMTPAYNIGGDVLQSIFSGGALSGALDYSKAAKEEMLASYRGTVLTAFREASDAQSQRTHDATRADQLSDAAKQAKEAYRIAKVRYQAGSTDFTTLLTAQRDLLSAQDGSVSALLDALDSTVTLYKALGGVPQVSSTH